MTSTYRDQYRKPQTEGEAAIRKCLMCREDFESAWAGDRICKRCKATAVWRNRFMETSL